MGKIAALNAPTPNSRATKRLSKPFWKVAHMLSAASNETCGLHRTQRGKVNSLFSQASRDGRRDERHLLGNTVSGWRWQQHHHSRRTQGRLLCFVMSCLWNICCDRDSFCTSALGFRMLRNTFDNDDSVLYNWIWVSQRGYLNCSSGRASARKIVTIPLARFPLNWTSLQSNMFLIANDGKM